jgi:hypothetical protein
MFNNLRFIKIPVIFITTLSLLSCEKIIEFKGKEQAPLLVINSILTEDSLLRATVSKSKFFLSNDENTAINNATVNIYVNNSFIGKYELYNYFSIDNPNDIPYTQFESFYTYPYRPKAGDHIRYEASAPGLQSVECETVIPQKTEILSLDTTMKSVVNQIGQYVEDSLTYYELGVSLKFRDKPNEKNYYCLAAYVKSVLEYADSEGNYHSDTIFYSANISSDDKVLNDINPFEGIRNDKTYNIYNIFSDELIDGKEYTIKFRYSLFAGYYGYGNEDVQETTIQLFSISEDYYRYLLTLTALDNVGGTSFAEPVQIHNNIKGGIGILGACAISEQNLKLK